MRVVRYAFAKSIVFVASQAPARARKLCPYQNELYGCRVDLQRSSVRSVHRCEGQRSMGMHSCTNLRLLSTMADLRLVYRY